MEYMGSHLTVKPARNGDDNSQSDARPPRGRSHHNDRKDYSRDQDGYPEYTGRRNYNRYNRYNSPQEQPMEQYPSRYVKSFIIKALVYFVVL